MTVHRLEEHLARPAVQEQLSRPSPELRALLIGVRAAIIQLLAAIDDALGLPRTLPTRAERRAGRRREET